MADLTPLEYAWKLINESERQGYAVEEVDANVIFLVTLNDKPFCAPDGQDLIFHRRIDAMRFIKERIADGDGKGEIGTQEVTS